MRAAWAASLFCAWMAIPPGELLPGAQDEKRTVRRSGSVFADEYVATPVLGFDVRFVAALHTGGTSDDVGRRVRVALERDLGDLLDQMPSGQHAFLRSVPIFVGNADPVALCACYHVSPVWLERNGFDPKKAKAVEIANARTYLDWRSGQPSMLMHELAHAFHDQVLGKQHPGILDALADVRHRDVYENTLRWQGGMDRHYALTTADEYFAETTEALFGVNDFYPFVRAELLVVDPGGARLVGELWGDPKKGVGNAKAGEKQMTDTRGLAEAEIAGLHDFFQAWFRGELPETDEAFARVADALAPEFEMVVPSGNTVGREGLLERLRAAHGKRDVEISTELKRVARLDAKHVHATYWERQLEGGVESVIVGTVVFEVWRGGVQWVHLQETRLVE